MPAKGPQGPVCGHQAQETVITDTPVRKGYLFNLVFKKFLSKLNPCWHCTSAGQLGQGVTEKAGLAAPRVPKPSSEQGPRAPLPAGHHACLFSSFLDKPPSKWGAGRGRGPSG